MLKSWLIALVAFFAVFATCAQTITVVTEEYPPYNFTDSAMKVSGLATEVVEEVLKRAKVDYRLGVYPWSRAYQMAQRAPNVLIYSIGRSAQREALFKWVGIIAPYDVYLYRLKSRADIQVTVLADAKRYTVGAVRDDVRAQYLVTQDITPELVSSDSANTKKLAAGRIDLFPIDVIGIVSLYKREGLDPASVVKVLKLDALSSGLYMAFSTQTSDDIINKCKAALAEVKQDGTFDRIRAKYLE